MNTRIDQRWISIGSIPWATLLRLSDIESFRIRMRPNRVDIEVEASEETVYTVSGDLEWGQNLFQSLEIWLSTENDTEVFHLVNQPEKELQNTDRDNGDQ